MKRFRLLGLTGLLAVLLHGVSAAAPGKPVVRFTTEESAPFFSATLPSNGLSGALLEAVLANMDSTMQIDYYPWRRAMEVGLHDPRYAGVVTMFRSPEREVQCHFSAPLGNRQAVLAYLKDKPLPATTLKDLSGIRVGTVAGYVYSEQFEELVHAGRISVEAGPSDEISLRKLLSRRFPAILIEKRKLIYLLGSGRFPPAARDSIAMADDLFAEHSTHVCFQRTAQGLALQQAFNKALRDVDLPKIERDYWRRLDAAPVFP